MSASFYLLNGSNEQTGPHSAQDILLMIRTGQVTWKSLAAQAGDDEWLPLSTFADVIHKLPGRAAVMAARTRHAPDEEPALPRQLATAAKSLGGASALIGLAGHFGRSESLVILGIILVAIALTAGVFSRVLKAQ